MELIDTHQHLVYPDVAGYAWTDGILPLANKEFTLETYKELTKNAHIIGTVFMETGADDADYQTEARFVAQLMQQKNSGILGIIASCRPEEDSGFSEWLDECANLGVVGYRRMLHVMDDNLSKSETFRRNVAAIGARGKTFDLCVLPKQLAIGMDLVTFCPNTKFILNHCGVPDIAGGGLDPWRANMTALASHENVTCKLSGLLAYCNAGTATLSSIRPYLDHVLEIFGPTRIVWGSDWPVVELANGLHDWIDITNAILCELSISEANMIGNDTTRRIYGL
ncbi:MAG: putative TIM-barrel fold metal-dependent hydrolase [Alteromonas macleodii]|jgi:predicted TIM-barrel fold metal-dependent hydrolase